MGLARSVKALSISYTRERGALVDSPDMGPGGPWPLRLGVAGHVHHDVSPLVLLVLVGGMVMVLSEEAVLMTELPERHATSLFGQHGHGLQACPRRLAGSGASARP
jgi:hypothetical protein